MKKNLLIKSSDRDSGSSSNFIIRSNEILHGEYIVNHVLIVNTIYNIDVNNNYFQLIDNSEIKNVYITPGNYNSSTFPIALKVLLDTASGGYNVYTVTFNTTTPKMTISASNVFSINPGLATSVFGINSTSSPSTSLTSTNIVTLGYLSSLGIVIDQANNSNIHNIKTSSTSTIYIPMNILYGYYKTMDTQELEQRLIFNQAVRQIYIRVIDTSTNKTVSLNGGEFEILLKEV